MSDKPTRIITPKFRANWVFLFEPRAPQETGKKPRYSVTMLFDKNTDLKPIKAAIAAALKEEYGEDSKKWPKMSFLPLKDQATAVRTNDQNEEYLPPGYEPGSFFMQANSYSPPGVIGPDKQTIIDPNAVYSGCYMRASVVFKAFEVSGKKGVTCYLQNVQKIADGERLGGRVEAEDEFSAIESTDVTPTAANEEDELAGLM